MTIQRRPRPQRRRQITAFLLSGAVLYLVAATAASPTARSAWEALGQRGDLALSLLRCQLGDMQAEMPLPVPVTLAIGQSPALLAGQEAVLELRRTEETEEEVRPDGPNAPEEPPAPTAPVPEEPAQPETPLLFADNGVAAKTLAPTSADGYVVTGDVYINNRSDNSLDASIFDGSFAAHLTEEEGPQVLIVHTHGSEAYTPVPGTDVVWSGDYRTTDYRYNVVKVGDEMAEVFVEAGLSVLHDRTLYDYPSYSGAYDRSLASIQRYLEEYPTIQYILDVHRDAIEDGQGNQYKVVSELKDGRTAAQMSLVIGSDGSGLSHPNWLQTLRLAATLQNAVLEEHPSLMRPITLRNSRHNQHAPTGSLLLEVGAAGNAPQEAILAGRLFAGKMAELLTAPQP